MSKTPDLAEPVKVIQKVAESPEATFDLWMELFLSVLTHPFTLMIMGVILHFLKQMIVEQKQWQRKLTFREYLSQNKLTTMFSWFSSVAVFALLYGSGELTKITAFTIGYLSDSVADLVGERGGRNLRDSIK